MKKFIFLFMMSFCTHVFSQNMHASQIQNISSWAVQHGVGKVNLPVSTNNAKAKKAFNIGLALLESYEYQDAENYFKLAQKIEPRFAMAYWGEAMSHIKILWYSIDYQKAKIIVQKMKKSADLDDISPLELHLIDSTRKLLNAQTNHDKQKNSSPLMQYRKAMSDVLAKFPNNPDVAALYANAVLGTRFGINDYANNDAAGSVLCHIYPQNKNHPGINHMILHSYENSAQSYLAKEAASRYAHISPGAIHGLHMPSHYYFYQGDWKKLNELNEYAWEMSLSRQQQMHKSDDSLEYHGYTWNVYALLQLSKMSKALCAIEAMHGKSQSKFRNNYLSHSVSQYLLHSQGNKRLQQSVLSLNFDEELLDDEYKTGFLFAKAVRKGYHQKKSINDAIVKVQSIMPCINNLGPSAKAEVNIMFKQLKALRLYAHGKSQPAFDALRCVSVEEDTAFREHGVPLIVKPSHELLADLLYEQALYGQALIEYKKELIQNPNKRLSLEGLKRSANKTQQTNDAEYAKNLLNKMT
jgi:hypothetical protein